MAGCYLLAALGTADSSQRIRVGHLLTSILVGGLEKFVLNLRAALPEDRFDLSVYSWTGRDAWRSEFQARGLPVQGLGGAHRIDSPLAPLRIALAWNRLVRRLREDRIQILHTHDFFPSLVGRTASLAAGTPHRVATLHNLYDWWPNWTHRANRLLARRTDAITCVSASVRDYFVAREGLPSGRYQTILNGVDETQFRPDPQVRAEMRRELGIGDGEILVGSVGSITTRKAQCYLVSAAHELLDRGFPLQVRIWGANERNPQHAEQEVREMIASLDLADRVQILPPRSDINRVYNAMDVHCMTSVAEGLSLASVEGLLSGPLCVYSDIGPFREVVDDGRTGYLFRSGDVRSLVQVLSEALPRLGELDEIRVRAREEGVRKFGLARMGREYAALYEELARR